MTNPTPVGRGRARARRTLLSLTTALCTGLAAPALAQIAPPPVRQSVDENGVDVLSGKFLVGQTNVSIGPSEGGLSYRSFAYDGRWSDDDVATINKVGNAVTVTVDGVSDGFTDYGGYFGSTEGNGATLVGSGTGYTYTSRNGTVVTFLGNAYAKFGFNNANMGRISQLVRPNGYTETYAYQSARYCGSGFENGTCPSGIKDALRIYTVRNSNGYRLTYSYASNADDLDLGTFPAWVQITGVVASNMAQSGPGSTAGATFTNSSSGSVTTRAVTDALNRTTTYANDYSSGTIRIKRPGASLPNVTVTYSSTTGQVASVTREGVTHAYSFAPNGTMVTTTVTAPDNSAKTYVGDTSTSLLTSFTDELNHTTAYSYDASGRVTQITYPEGNKAQYTYDARGNVTQQRLIAKTPGTPADIVTSASFPLSCTNVVTCNQPTSTTDARNNTTDYTYDATHGGVLTVTAPAPTSGAVRPQQRFTYAIRNAYYDPYGGGGTPIAGPDTYVLTATSTCQTAASCTGSADEVATTIGYGPQSAGTPNNLLPVSVAMGSGDGALTAIVTAGYDAIGNRTTVDGPLPGTADTMRTVYDAARQPVGVIGPDPDGGGARPNQATRTTYNADGEPTLQEIGTTTGQSDAAWAGFSSYQGTAITYDGNARPVASALTAGGTTYQLTQSDYDSRGRPQCVAQRMNPGAFGSLPASACTLGTAGSYGPDRISRLTYDAAGRQIKLTTAYGTAEQADEATATYTANGQAASATDAEGNQTSYGYDGFDRLATTMYPSTAKGAGISNGSDYEQLGYDAAGNMTSRRLRDGTTATFAYDALDRVTQYTPPPTTNDDTMVTYGYDLLGRLTQASSVAGSQVAFTWDALGRKTNESNYYYSLASQYDLAGRRTRLTWHDGLYVSYLYDDAGNMTGVRENGTGYLANYGYDSLGRRTSLTRGNATATSYGYDAVGRLASLSHDLAGTAHDVAFGYGYNPAGQIVSRTSSNDAYAAVASNASKGYTSDGLNRYTAAGGVTPTYDARGNVTSAGPQTYQWTSENRLFKAPGVGAYLGDALGRLDYIQAEGAVLLGHDGDQLSLETPYTSTPSTIGRRYAYGAGADEPLVWYEGNTNSDKRWLLADERGSIIAVTDGVGNAVNLNRYDEYGNAAPRLNSRSAPRPGRPGAWRARPGPCARARRCPAATPCARLRGR